MKRDHSDDAASLGRKVLALILMAGMLSLPAGGTPLAEMAAPAEVRDLALALGPDGLPWAVWAASQGDDTDLFYSRWADGGWLPARPVLSRSGTWEANPSLAFAGDGTPWLAWSSAQSDGSSWLSMSRWTGRRWSEPEVIPTRPSTFPRQPSLAAAPDGGLWLAWVGHDGTDDEIYASRWDTQGWTTPQRVGYDDDSPEAYDTHPRLAIGPQGEVWLVWVSSQGLFHDAIVASRWEGESWSPEQRASARDGLANVWPSVALDAQGQPWVAWQRLTALDAKGRWRIYTARWDPELGAWTDEALASSPPTLPIHEGRPSLAFDPAGQPHLAWTVTGALQGVAYTTQAGGAWLPPAWTAADQPVLAPALLGSDSPWLFWSTDAAPLAAPPGGELEFQRLAPVPADMAPDTTARLLQPEAAFLPNRHMAFGDSITWGELPLPDGTQTIPYPTRLEARLDDNVTASEVINRGVPGERTEGGVRRIGDEASVWQPQFVLILEGTNDISNNNTCNEIADNLLIMFDILRRTGIRPRQVVLSTLTPRLDWRRRQVVECNPYIAGVAGAKGAALADAYEALVAYGNYAELYLDALHPGDGGLQIVADEFYATLIAAGMLVEDDTPPTARVLPLPAQSPCGAVAVAWEGDDGEGTGVRSFDVQVRRGAGEWRDWLVETPHLNATYSGGQHNQSLGFRVRARDGRGNVGTFSPEVTTLVVDNSPPQDVGVIPLPPYQLAPFTVSWYAHDACSPIASYDVETRVGSGPWNTLLSQTTATSTSFSPSPPQCGQTYHFQVRACDTAGNCSAWSTQTASTTLACHAASGQVRTVRGTPIFRAQPSASPAPLGADLSDGEGRYTLYFGSAGSYDLSATRAGFGQLPARRAVVIAGQVAGLDFCLPPLDDQVQNGGFEEGTWGAWQRGGSQLPTLTATAHSGQGAAELHPQGGDSRLSQTLELPTSLDQATLSLMARLAGEGNLAGTLIVEVKGTTTLTEMLAVPAGGWVHAWYDVSAFEGETVTLALSVTGGPAVIVDEVSLGSAAPGVYGSYLPLLSAAAGAAR
jgi:lysophospholipase L1-like esterase